MIDDKVLQEMNRKYMGSDHFLSKNLLTLTNRISAPRVTMWDNVTGQYEVLTYPQPSKIFTRYENLVGSYSTAYLKSEEDYTVIAKIPKFSHHPEYMYTLVIQNNKTGEFDILDKKCHEKLTETYGFKYNTEVIDSKTVGSNINKNEVLYKSTSFDKYMNYCYGINAKTLYLIEDGTIEDALIISKSCAKRLKSKHLDTVRISVNDNDLLINYYGDHNEYKSIPDIGEKIKDKTVAVKRRIDYGQILYDLKLDNQDINYTTDTAYYSKGRVIDIDIYANKSIEELEDGYCNEQVLNYIKDNDRYNREICELLGDIMNRGSKYTDDLAFLYKRCSDTLDPEYKWKLGNSNNIFNNIVIDITVEYDSEIHTGSKITGAFGDKGVISHIWKDEDMPFLADGTRVDIICNELGVGNRLNGSQKYFVEVNFIASELYKKMRKLKTFEEREKLFFSFLYDINKVQYEYVYGSYKNFKMEVKQQIIQDVLDNKFRLHEPPFWGNFSIELLDKLYTKYDIDKVDVYVKKFGNVTKLMNKLVVGDKYIIKLKHTPESKFSVRSTGYINSKELPDKSNASKQNKSLFSQTAVKKGEQENQNMLMCKDVDFVRDMNYLYAVSTNSRRNMANQLLTRNPLDIDGIDIDPEDTNISATELELYMNCKGFDIVIGEDDDEDIYDDDTEGLDIE